jgi:hypothetical protein
MLTKRNRNEPNYQSVEHIVVSVRHSSLVVVDVDIQTLLQRERNSQMKHFINN